MEPGTAQQSRHAHDGQHQRTCGIDAQCFLSHKKDTKEERNRSISKQLQDIVVAFFLDGTKPLESNRIEPSQTIHIPSERRFRRDKQRRRPANHETIDTEIDPDAPMEIRRVGSITNTVRKIDGTTAAALPGKGCLVTHRKPIDYQDLWNQLYRAGIWSSQLPSDGRALANSSTLNFKAQDFVPFRLPLEH